MSAGSTMSGNNKRRNKHVLAPASVKRALLAENNTTCLRAMLIRHRLIYRSSRITSKKNKRRPPSIIITNKTYTETRALLNVLSLSDYALKVTIDGMKIQFDNDSDYDATCVYLRDEKIEHFTHKKKEDKSFKAVMYGLPKTDLNELKQFFDSRLNIATNGIYEIKTNSTDHDTAIYLFHFNKKDIYINGSFKQD